MQLEHSFTVPADIDTSWTTLLDVERVALCMPGATLTSVEGDTFTARAAGDRAQAVPDHRAPDAAGADAARLPVVAAARVAVTAGAPGGPPRTASAGFSRY